MSTPRFYVKMIDPDDFTKEKVVWGNPCTGKEPTDETEAECKLWDGLIYRSDEDEEWGDCGGKQNIYLSEKSVKLGLDVCDVGESDKVKTRVAYSSNRGKLLEDQVIALANIVATLTTTISFNTGYVSGATSAAAKAVAAAVKALQ